MSIHDLLGLRDYYFYRRAQTPENIERTEKIDRVLDRIVDESKIREPSK
jgi:hypothetical protein